MLATTRDPSTSRQGGRGARRLARGLGLLMVIAGVAILGYLAWQYWGTNWVAKTEQAEVKGAIEAEWADGSGSGEARSPDRGTGVALLRVPRFGEDYEQPVVVGFDDDSLARGVGMYPKGVMPGRKGNFAIAGHRVTHGEPFRDFLDLRAGDRVEVETRTAVHVYELRNAGDSLTLDFTVGWPLQPVPDPGWDGSRPTESVLTMLTCSELFHTDDRNVVFGDLVSTERKRA